MPNFEKVVALQRSAFPPEEQYPIEQLLKLAKKPNIEYLSFWTENELCGIMLFCSGKSMAYLFYLAVNSDLRSRGYGAKMLEWLKEHLDGKTIVLNMERVGFDAANEGQRVRRWHFYERLGYIRQSYYLSDDSGEYDIVTSEEYFNLNEYMELIEQIGFGAYHPKLIKKVWQ